MLTADNKPIKDPTSSPKAVLRNSKDLLRFRFRLWKKVLVPVPAPVPVLVPAPVPDLDNILHSFPTTKNVYNILPFQSQMKHYFPERWAFIFDFFTFLFYFMMEPVPQHCLKVCFTLENGTHRQQRDLAPSKIFV